MTERYGEVSDEDGFSILEMIVAMTILSLILGIAAQTIVLASRSISAARERVEDARRLREILADYDAGGYRGGDAHSTDASGWVFKTSSIEVSRTKMTAVVVEQAGKRSGSFLTFVPDTRPQSQ